MTNELTEEQKQAIDDMIIRRMDNTGETFIQARDHIISFIQKRVQNETTTND